MFSFYLLLFSLVPQNKLAKVPYNFDYDQEKKKETLVAKNIKGTILAIQQRNQVTGKVYITWKLIWTAVGLVSHGHGLDNLLSSLIRWKSITQPLTLQFNLS